jgi:hypothetical protein
VVVTRIAAGLVLCSLAARTTLSTSSHRIAAGGCVGRAPLDRGGRHIDLLWRLRAIPEMRKACFRLEPVGALIDAWILARQVHQLFREGAGAAAFGPLQPEAVAVSRRLVEQMRHIGGSISVSPEARARFEQNVIDPWLGAHLLPDITFTRDSPIAAIAEQARSSGDALQSVATMEELAFTVSQQMRIYLADLPRQVRGELDLVRADMFPDSLAALEDELHVSAAAAGRPAATAEAISPLVLSERRIVLDEMSLQRELVMEALSLERERAVGAFVRAFAAERGELLRAFEAQRLATLDWATAERSAVIAEVRRELAGAMGAVRDERVIVVDDVRRIVDAVLLRVAMFLVAAVVLAPLVAHAYARVRPRRLRSPVDAIRAER